MDIINDIIVFAVIFSPAIAAAALFVFALVRFMKAKGDPEKRRSRKGLLIASSIIFGIVAAAYIAMIVLLSLAIRNM